MERTHQPQHCRRNVSDALGKIVVGASLRDTWDAGRIINVVTYATIAAAGAVTSRVILTGTGFPVNNAGTPSCEAA